MAKGMQPDEGDELKKLNLAIEALAADEKDPDPVKASEAGRKREELIGRREALLAQHGEGFHKLLS